ncbi:MAG: hypothetical protein LBE62_02265 [Azonexus sp.]|nr:hypothetical protein [Azonexus sp.]
MDQISLYYREACRHENERQAAAIVAANLGFNGGKAAGEAVKKLVKD